MCDSDCIGSEENLPPSENNQRKLVICYRDSLCTGVELRIWLKQDEEKSLLARIFKILEEARKRLSRQKSNKKVCESDKKNR